MKWLASCFLVLAMGVVAAPLQSPVPQSESRFMAYLVKHTPTELEYLFQRAAMLAQDSSEVRQHEPIVFILHGDETFAFLNANAQRFSNLIGLARQLDEQHIIDVRVCEAWMLDHGIQRADLPDFIDTVPNGPEYGRQLKQSGYLYF
ncbi:hypothetical protein ACFVYJ_05440 [Pontibacter sp. JAM-7]|uniref:DsrE family protein n=1 Tax=Pontibacter sp. JAM-7 TaxID=3366581 RepID=UPI003AF4FAB3